MTTRPEETQSVPYDLDDWIFQGEYWFASDR